jgi:hypothetical protein
MLPLLDFYHSPLLSTACNFKGHYSNQKEFTFVIRKISLFIDNKLKPISMSKVLMVAATGLLIATAAHAQKRESIEGNGKIITRDVKVSSFNSLKASGVYELKLSQGNTEAVKIEADENLQDLFQVHNEGDKLVIEMKKMENKNFNNKTKLKVYVTFKNLKEMELSTVGNVASEEQLSFGDLDLKNKSVGNVNLELTASRIDIKNTSVGNVHLSGKADNAIVKNSGVGSIEAGNFVVQTMDIENTGVGHAEVNAAKDLKVKDSFLGKVRNKGAAATRRMNTVKV